MYFFVADTAAIVSFEPMPASGVLTACAGDHILLTCSHNNQDSGVTRWIFSQPVDCSETIFHDDPSSIEPCGPFTYESVSLASNVMLFSIVTTNVSTSMNGTVIECRDSAGQIYDSAQLTLCITG